MSLVSIFVNKPPVTFDSPTDPDGRVLVSANYHFDAVVKYNLDLSARYSRYPIEYGADIQDHAFNEPTKVLVYGYMGSRSLRMSVNQLPEFGASAVLGNANNETLSTAAGIAGDIGVNTGALAGEEQLRPANTFGFLKELKERFATFTFVSDLVSFPYMKIDRLTSEINEENEAGLEFIVELSQLRYSGELPTENNIDGLPESDAAKTQAAPLIERGRIAVA